MTAGHGKLMHAMQIIDVPDCNTLLVVVYIAILCSI